MPLNNHTIIEKAKELGFDLVGFSPAVQLNSEADHLKEWLSKNYNATMEYMSKNFDKRSDVKNIFPAAKSVISLAMNYYTPYSHLSNRELTEQKKGKVSRYAWGKDYHLVIWEKLDILKSELKKIDPDFDCITYVDTGPTMDKAWAVRSGIGWQGKHSNVISKEIGSWFFLSTLICNREFNYSPPVADHCGSCTACIDACPTNAIVDNYLVDSSRCISFLTIENKGDIPNEYKNKFEDWIFGCDICQDVCPWNKKFSAVTSIPEFYPHGNKEISLEEVEFMSEDLFKKRFELSSIKRSKLKGLKRNAKFLQDSV